jgi:cytochrome c oxidase subunit I
MFLTGMGTTISAFFQTTTMIISIPSVIILTALILSLWGGSIRFNTPMLFALAFLPMFGIGGLTGLPLGLAAADIHLHDTYYVIGHFHYVVAPGTIFALFAGIYYWFPKVTGRRMNEFWARCTSGPVCCLHERHLLARCSSRGWPACSGASTTAAPPTRTPRTCCGTNVLISMSAWGLGLAQLPFIINFFWSIKKGAPVGGQRWQATTLEWAARLAAAARQLPAPRPGAACPTRCRSRRRSSEMEARRHADATRSNRHSLHRRSTAGYRALTTSSSGSGCSSPPR